MKRIVIVGETRFANHILQEKLQKTWPNIAISTINTNPSKPFVAMNEHSNVVIVATRSPKTLPMPSAPNVVRVLSGNEAVGIESGEVYTGRRHANTSVLEALLLPMLDLSPPTLALLAIDIETNGPSTRHNSILSIGWCLGGLDGKVLVKRRVDLKPQKKKSMDPYTQRTFWDARAETLSALQINAMEPATAIRIFLRELDAYDRIFSLRVLTDNPAFDMAFINEYVQWFVDRPPIAFKFGDKSKYRPIYDTDSFNRAFLCQSHENAWTMDADVEEKLGVRVRAADHFPENDAEHIYELHVLVMREIGKSGC